jgi:hypothetical protein
MSVVMQKVEEKKKWKKSFFFGFKRKRFGGVGSEWGIFLQQVAGNDWLVLCMSSFPNWDTLCFGQSSKRRCRNQILSILHVFCLEEKKNSIAIEMLQNLCLYHPV